ncbi:beta-N-acetylhexosaminidase [uncultured Leifsonia sp.]|uniref:beta-N-acetylhexosaminidase n=1 Tax=uncultured Leifsonia sp. TaxID=340359 RepID=UPI0025EBEDA5|nr:beta-N-acetylhexosaminidase [uncultured Leifsonia sp.]
MSVTRSDAIATPTPTDTALRRRIAATLLPGFVGTTLPAWLEARLRDGLGGVCLFGQNVESAAQLRALTDAVYAANPNAIVAIDEEGGDVTRLYYDSGSPFPGNAVLGRLGDESYTEAVARRVGEELNAVGVNLDLAPDVDINSNADNPVIGVRSFGSSPETVAAQGAAWTRGLQSAGVAVCAKHFPGHGDTAQDSHLELPEVDLTADQLRERELLPFRAVVEAGARTVMTSHILLPRIDPDLPATFSPAVVEGMLRGELGFTGVVVTDALDMHGASGERGIPEAAVLALAAGCDLLCIGTENTDAQLTEIEDAIAAAIVGGRLTAERVEEAAGRVLALAEGVRVDAAAYAAEPRPAGPRGLAGDIDDEDVRRALDAFDISGYAWAWLREHHGHYSIVRVDTVANIAIGQAPWGPFAEVAAGSTHEGAGEGTDSRFAAGPLVVFTEGDHPDLVLAASAPVLVVGKDNHRHAFARAAIDRLRSERDSALVVDMGWPSDDRAYADIATFGASRLIGRALIELLDRDLGADADAGESP